MSGLLPSSRRRPQPRNTMQVFPAWQLTTETYKITVTPTVAAL